MTTPEECKNRANWVRSDKKMEGEGMRVAYALGAVALLAAWAYAGFLSDKKFQNYGKGNPFNFPAFTMGIPTIGMSLAVMFHAQLQPRDPYCNKASPETRWDELPDNIKALGILGSVGPFVAWALMFALHEWGSGKTTKRDPKGRSIEWGPAKDVPKIARWGIPLTFLAIAALAFWAPQVEVVNYKNQTAIDANIR